MADRETTACADSLTHDGSCSAVLCACVRVLCHGVGAAPDFDIAAHCEAWQAAETTTHKQKFPIARQVVPAGRAFRPAKKSRTTSTYSGNITRTCTLEYARVRGRTLLPRLPHTTISATAPPRAARMQWSVRRKAQSEPPAPPVTCRRRRRRQLARASSPWLPS